MARRRLSPKGRGRNTYLCVFVSLWLMPATLFLFLNRGVAGGADAQLLTPI
jgi:hypothetical protein